MVRSGKGRAPAMQVGPLAEVLHGVAGLRSRGRACAILTSNRLKHIAVRIPRAHGSVPQTGHGVVFSDYLYDRFFLFFFTRGRQPVGSFMVVAKRVLRRSSA
jgi:hypothetical protein